jgi:hypothetical protein
MQATAMKRSPASQNQAPRSPSPGRGGDRRCMRSTTGATRIDRNASARLCGDRRCMCSTTGALVGPEQLDPLPRGDCLAREACNGHWTQ